MAAIDETILLNGISLGDKRAFDEIYNQYHSDIYKYVFKFVKSSDCSEDLCQEIFLKVWEKRENLADVRSFRAYLFTVSKNHIFDFLRHASVEQSAREEILYASRDLKNQVEDSIQSEEYYQHLQKVLDQMSPRNQEVFKLCREMDQTYDEAAEVLGISRNAIKKHMVKTMKLLKCSAQKSFGLSFNSLLSVFILLGI